MSVLVKISSIPDEKQEEGKEEKEEENKKAQRGRTRRWPKKKIVRRK